MAQNKRSWINTALGVVGELLITFGVLIGLFVVWQLWWTDVQAAAVRDVAVKELTKDFGKPVENKIGKPRYDEPPTIITSGNNENFAILRVPRWGKDYAVQIAEGTNQKKVLDKGAIGHYANTALPGQVGNFSAAGHRQSHGAVLYSVDQLQPGDPMIVETENAYLIYKYTGKEIVSPNNGNSILPVPNQPEAAPTDRLMTLTTCHPLYTTKQRWIVYSKFDHWVAREDGLPAELKEAK